MGGGLRARGSRGNYTFTGRFEADGRFIIGEAWEDRGIRLSDGLDAKIG